MRDVYEQIHTFVTLEDIAHTGRSQRVIVLGLLSAAMTVRTQQSCILCYHFCWLSFRQTEKCWYRVYLCLFIHVCLVWVCYSLSCVCVHNKGSRMLKYLYLLLQYFGFMMRNPEFLMNSIRLKMCGCSWTGRWQCYLASSGIMKHVSFLNLFNITIIELHHAITDF